MKHIYNYRGLVTKVYDGDTITVDIDLGFQVSVKKQKIRLYRINAPEVTKKEKKKGIVTRDWLRKKILNKEVLLITYKDKKGKYGRWLADVWFDDVCINDELVKKKLAVYKDY